MRKTTQESRRGRKSCYQVELTAESPQDIIRFVLTVTSPAHDVRGWGSKTNLIVSKERIKLVGRHVRSSHAEGMRNLEKRVRAEALRKVRPHARKRVVGQKHIPQNLPREVLNRAGVLEAESLPPFPKRGMKGSQGSGYRVLGQESERVGVRDGRHGRDFKVSKTKIPGTLVQK
jgi:hypothetical protein